MHLIFTLHQGWRGMLHKFAGFNSYISVLVTLKHICLLITVILALLYFICCWTWNVLPCMPFIISFFFIKYVCKKIYPHAKIGSWTFRQPNIGQVSREFVCLFRECSCDGLGCNIAIQISSMWFQEHLCTHSLQHLNSSGTFKYWWYRKAIIAARYCWNLLGEFDLYVI